MAAAMMPAAEMVAVTSAMVTPTTMAAAMMTAAVAATVTASMTTAASRDGKIRYRQHHCEDNGGNSEGDL